MEKTTFEDFRIQMETNAYLIAWAVINGWEIKEEWKTNFLQGHEDMMAYFGGK